MEHDEFAQALRHRAAGALEGAARARRRIDQLSGGSAIRAFDVSEARRRALRARERAIDAHKEAADMQEEAAQRLRRTGATQEAERAERSADEEREREEQVATSGPKLS